jgi:hypothetical protein
MLLIMLTGVLAGPPLEELHTPAPQLTQVTAWLNSSELKLSDLKGKVLVVHFFAFG